MSRQPSYINRFRHLYMFLHYITLVQFWVLRHRFVSLYFRYWHIFHIFKVELFKKLIYTTVFLENKLICHRQRKDEFSKHNKNSIKYIARHFQLQIVFFLFFHFFLKIHSLYCLKIKQFIWVNKSQHNSNASLFPANLSLLKLLNTFKVSDKIKTRFI